MLAVLAACLASLTCSCTLDGLLGVLAGRATTTDILAGGHFYI